MAEPSTLAHLLKLVLDLPRDAPVFATPGFAPWTGGEAPPRGVGGGLWLVDTRDRGALAELARAGGFDAALVVAGNGAPGSALRRLARRLRHGARLPEARVAESLRRVAAGHHARRFGFADLPEVPTDFEVGTSTGAAFLLTRSEPFAGPLWSRIRERLGDAEPRVTGLHLRERGAAVLPVVTRGGRHVVRIVPAEGPQEVVLRNHTALTALRDSLAGHDALLALIPRPVFAEMHEGALILGESCLPGTLAWRAAPEQRATAVYRGALAFLAGLRDATARSAREAGDILPLLRRDVDAIDAAPFVGRDVARELRRELRDAARVLAGEALRLHTSHGDFGYGNLLVHPASGALAGVIDWDTARAGDLPGIDRVNLEIQLRRDASRHSFADAVRRVWEEGAADEALRGPGGPARTRALFGVAVCRYVVRSLAYPAVYREEAEGFERALAWLARSRATPEARPVLALPLASGR